MSERRIPCAASLVLGMVLLSTTGTGLAGTLTITSPPHRVALVELYTSEGCSSCPPADRWVSSLKNEPGLWNSFIPLSFHVDYWDYIGWPDRFASPAYTARQHRHASDQSMRVVYTPGFFLNGLEWRWRGRNLGDDIIAEPAGVLGVEVGGTELRIRFESGGDDRDLSASVALLGFGIETRVEAGENAGRTLRHDFVVLSVDEASLRRSGDVHHATLAAPSAGVDAERYAIVAWINAGGSQVPIQAVGGWWKPM